MAGILSIRRCSSRKFALAALAIGCFLLGFANPALSQASDEEVWQRFLRWIPSAQPARGPTGLFIQYGRQLVADGLSQYEADRQIAVIRKLRSTRTDGWQLIFNNVYSSNNPAFVAIPDWGVRETRLIRFVAQKRNPAATQPSPPIIDLHFHFNGSWDVDAFVERMDTLGVTRAGNAPYGAPDALALEWARKHTDRFIPFAGKEAIRDLIRSEGARAWNLQAPAVPAYLQQLDTALKAGNFKGIGEINVYPGPPFPADSPLMQRLWSLSAEHQVPLSIHLDARDEPVAQMERLLASNRRGTLIWAHAGGAGPALVRRLMQAYPNLHADLSGRLPALMRIREWKVLLEEFPDRFVIGSDVPTLEAFVETIGAWRKILDGLHPATARKLAYENAERLLNSVR